MTLHLCDLCPCVAAYRISVKGSAEKPAYACKRREHKELAAADVMDLTYRMEDLTIDVSSSGFRKED